MPRALSVGEGLWLIVADVPLATYNERSIESRLRDSRWVTACALAHEAVVERFTTSPALAPMKLFTIFASDDRAVERIATRRAQIGRALDRVAGCVEWGVRLDGGSSRAPIREPARPPGPVSGRAFLERKRRLRDDNRTLATRERRQADQIYRSLRHQARAATRREPLQVAGAVRRTILDATYLVPARAAAFRAEARAWARRLAAGGHTLTLTGPWPPYHFVAPPR